MLEPARVIGTDWSGLARAEFHRVSNRKISRRALIRLYQQHQAVLNVRKHADARHVEIRVALDGGYIEIVVADDGRGFDPARVPHGHLGLLTMRERAEALGGEFAVYTAPGRGTRIVARIPT